MKKRILGILLTMALIIGLVTAFSLGAGATDDGEHSQHCVCGATHEAVGNHTEEEIINWVAWDGVSEISYDSNKTAYVYLAADVALSERVFVQDNYKLYICLNGHNISAAEEYEVSQYGAAFRLEGYADLTITDCKNTVNEGYVDAQTGLWTPGTAEEEGDVTYNLSGGVIYGFNASGSYGTIYELLSKYGFKPLNLKNFSELELLEFMKKDKKALQDKISFIIPTDKKVVKEIKLSFDEVLEMFK